MVGVTIGVAPLFLPWDSAFIWSDDMSVVAHVTMNIFDFFASNETAIVFGASLFTAGMVLTFINRWLVIAQLIGMIVLSFTMYSYLSSKLPTLHYPDTFPSGTGFGIGYYLGWLSILILGALLINEKGKEWSQKRERHLPGSETVNKELGGLEGWIIRGGRGSLWGP